MNFEIVDIQPESGYQYKRRGVHSELCNALLALPDGKSIKVPLDTFKQWPSSNLAHFSKRIGRKVNSRKRPDGWYLWLDPVSINGAHSEGQ